MIKYIELKCEPSIDREAKYSEITISIFGLVIYKKIVKRKAY